MGYLAYARYGVDGLRAAGVAALICLVSGSLALAAVAAWTSRGAPLAGTLLGTAARTGLPLAAALVARQEWPGLDAVGFFPLVLGFYLVMLATETMLSVRMIAPSSTQSGSP